MASTAVVLLVPAPTANRPGWLKGALMEPPASYANPRLVRMASVKRAEKPPLKKIWSITSTANKSGLLRSMPRCTMRMAAWFTSVFSAR